MTKECPCIIGDEMCIPCFIQGHHAQEEYLVRCEFCHGSQEVWIGIKECGCPPPGCCEEHWHDDS